VIKAGELDEKIELFSPAAGTDDGFTTVPSGWTTRGTIACRYMAGTVREVFENSGREGELPAVFKVRRWTLTESILETWKLVYRGDTYDIKGAVRDGRDAIRITAVGSDEPVLS
jgi:hypothetical protein